MDGVLSGANTLDQSGPEINGNKGVLQCFSIGASPSDGLVADLGLSLGKSYPSAETQLLYSIARGNLGTVYFMPKPSF